MKTTNCHIRDRKPGDIYCGRGKGAKWHPLLCFPGEEGYWGNPLALGKVCPVCKETHQAKGSTLKCYEIFLQKRLKKDPIFKEEFLKLQGKRLVCFCKPEACHTDVMIQYLERLK